MSASLIWLDQDASAARLLDDVIFAGYLDGLRDAGCQANPRLVRFGYAAACALRWGLLGLWWLEGLSDSAKIAALEAKWGRPVEELAQQWAAATYYVLDVAGEAHDLYRALF